MGNQAEAQKAIGMFHAFSLQNRALTVNPARARDDRGGSPSKLGASGTRYTPHKHRPRGGNRRNY
jgi:hypothetical protein